MKRFLPATVILPTPCPECRREAMTYNGNYFCTECDFSLPPDGKMSRGMAELAIEWYAELMDARDTPIDPEALKISHWMYKL